MTMLALRGTVILPDRLLEGGVVVCRDGRIVEVGDGPVPRGAKLVEGAIVAPGFVDLHTHGAAG